MDLNNQCRWDAFLLNCSKQVFRGRGERKVYEKYDKTF
jgi:hypothetical protein